MNWEGLRRNWVSEGAGRAFDRAGGAGRPTDGAKMSSKEAGKASQGAIFAILRALGQGNREINKAGYTALSRS